MSGIYNYHDYIDIEHGGYSFFCFEMQFRLISDIHSLGFIV